MQGCASTSTPAPPSEVPWDDAGAGDATADSGSPPSGGDAIAPPSVDAGDAAAPPSDAVAATAPSIVHLVAYSDQILSAQNGGGGAVTADRNAVGTAEMLTLVPGGLTLTDGLTDGASVSFQTSDGAHFLSTSGGMLSATATSAGATETFRLHALDGSGVIHDGSQVSLQTSGGQYLTAAQGGGGAIQSTATTVGPSETFRIYVTLEHNFSWYVANTQAGEWIQYDQVWMTDGNYRFTAQVAATSPGQTVHLEVDGVPVEAAVQVPNTGRFDRFVDVSLGAVHVAQGVHDLRLAFDTGGTSVDWFMFKKSTDSSSTVTFNDITMSLPPATTKPLISPIVGFAEYDFAPDILDRTNHPFSNAQQMAYYGYPMYPEYDRRVNEYWDFLVQELLESRAPIPIFHCRATADFTSSLDDRSYVAGGGGMEGRWLSRLFEAVSRSPQADSALRIGMFWENNGTADGFQQMYGYFPAWGDQKYVDYEMQYWLEPWFDNVPPGKLFEVEPGRPLIRFYSGAPQDIVEDGKMVWHIEQLRTELKAKYGFNPLFLLAKQNIDVDPSSASTAWGVADWLQWGPPLYSWYTFMGNVWGTASDGSKRRLDTVWLNDWNPVTDTGGPYPGCPNSPSYNDFFCGNSSHQSRLTANGDSALRASFQMGVDKGAVMINEEGFTNISEGNGIYRSYHPEWKFPNQHIGVMRQFADPVTDSMMFEAEACDEYSDTTMGNSGRAFRVEHYTHSTDLDVYRAPKRLTPWVSKNATPKLVQLDAGFFDVWGVDAQGNLWDEDLDGTPDSWTGVDTGGNPIAQISVGRDWAWAVTKNGKVLHAQLPYGWPGNGHTSWVSESSTPIVSLDVAAYGFNATDLLPEVWGLTADGSVYHRPADGSKPWAAVSGLTASSLSVGRDFVWAIDKAGSISYSPVDSPGSWTAVGNTNAIVQLSVGTSEVWGVTKQGAVYRRDSGGLNDWELVDGNLSEISVGESFVWGLSGTQPESRGFR